MGLLALNRVMSMQQDRHHRQIQPRSKPPLALLVASVLLCFHNPRGSKRTRRSVPELLDLPQDIWTDILSRLPMRDAAQAGCVSRTFLSAWKCRPNLIFSEETLGPNGKTCAQDILKAWHAGAFSP
ncbi:hypothetical protein ACQ4PT_014128 [Festuca glaucescens]